MRRRMNSAVYALAVDGGGNLYAGGAFTTAGSVSANSIARWNGTTWSALGSGMNNWVYDLAVDGSGNLYAGGSFTTAGSVYNSGRRCAYVCSRERRDHTGHELAGPKRFLDQISLAANRALPVEILGRVAGHEDDG